MSGNTFLRNLRTLSFIEGVSTLVLFFIAMPLKYMAGKPMAVSIAGSVHGFLFVFLVVMFALSTQRIGMPIRTALLGLIAAIFPFGPFVFDKKLAALAKN